MFQSKKIGREKNRPYIYLRNCCIARRLIRNIVNMVWTRREYNHWETEGLIWKKKICSCHLCRSLSKVGTWRNSACARPVESCISQPSPLPLTECPLGSMRTLHRSTWQPNNSWAQGLSISSLGEIQCPLVARDWQYRQIIVSLVRNSQAGKSAHQYE